MASLFFGSDVSGNGTWESTPEYRALVLSAERRRRDEAPYTTPEAAALRVLANADESPKEGDFQVERVPLGWAWRVSPSERREMEHNGAPLIEPYFDMVVCRISKRAADRCRLFVYENDRIVDILNCVPGHFFTKRQRAEGKGGTIQW